MYVCVKSYHMLLTLAYLQGHLLTDSLTRVNNLFEMATGPHYAAPLRGAPLRGAGVMLGGQYSGVGASYSNTAYGYLMIMHNFQGNWLKVKNKIVGCLSWLEPLPWVLILAFAFKKSLIMARTER